MTVIVLGSSGFLGSSLISKLKEDGINCKSMIRQKNHLNKNNFFGNITKEGFLDGEISNNDIIVNLVGQNNNDTSKLFDENVNGAFNLLNSVIKKKNIKIIFASSTTVYDEDTKKASKESDSIKPTADYQIVKALAESIYRNYSMIYGINITILRFSNVYGPNKKAGIIFNCLESIKNQKPIIIDHGGNQIRDFLFVDDAVQGITKTLQTPLEGFNILNISSGKGIQIKKILKLIENISKRKITVEFTSQKFDKKNLFANNTKAKNLVNFIPEIKINEGLKRIFLKN